MVESDPPPDIPTDGPGHRAGAVADGIEVLSCVARRLSHLVRDHRFVAAGLACLGVVIIVVAVVIRTATN